MTDRLLDSTLDLPPWPDAQSAIKGVALTIAFHPDPDRIGQCARLTGLFDGGWISLSRLEPLFAPLGGSGGAPLGDPYVSRTPIHIAPASAGGVHVMQGEGSVLSINGEPLVGERELTRVDLARGAVIELANRVVLVLHLISPPTARQPSLGFVGESDAIERVRASIVRIADLDTPVLLTGESGTGKELAARAIAQAGHRCQAPFVAVNMAAIPPTVAVSELFGHEAGAFTGAEKHRQGYFAQANGGTIFLDEVGDTPTEVQAMLLRTLERHSIRPLGGPREEPIDVRVIAATDSDLDQTIARGSFRSALFHRLAGYQIVLPALRDRREDVGRLLVHFLRQELDAVGEPDRIKTLGAGRSWFPAQLAAALVRYDWPGNVRQLGNVVRQLVVSARGRSHVSLEILPKQLLEWAVERATTTDSGDLTAPPRVQPADISEEALTVALRANGWRPSATARELGISRTTLYQLIERSDGIRKAKDIPEDELRACYEACGGDLDAMAAKLEVSAKGLKLRLR